MWCLMYIAVAGSAPQTDCSLPTLDECLVRTIVINQNNWREDMATIPYLSLCVSLQERERYLQSQLIERAKAHR
jgi:hypothetical protein